MKLKWQILVGAGGAERSGGVSLQVQGVMLAPSELQTAICPGKSDERIGCARDEKE